MISMKGLPHVFLARPALAGILLLLAACQTVETPQPLARHEIHGGWQQGQKIMMAAFCRSAESVMAIAKGDAVSKEAAEAAFQIEAKKRNCVSFGQPRFIGVVAEVLSEYPDYNGDMTQVLRIVSPKAPDQSFYMLALKRIAQRTRYENRPMDCVNCREA